MNGNVKTPRFKVPQNSGGGKKKIRVNIYHEEQSEVIEFGPLISLSTRLLLFSIIHFSFRL